MSLVEYESPILNPRFIISSGSVLLSLPSSVYLTRVEDHEGMEMTLEELAEGYYTNPEDYFQPRSNKGGEKRVFPDVGVQDEYSENDKITNELQEEDIANIKDDNNKQENVKKYSE